LTRTPFVLGLFAILCCSGVLAQYRVAVEPSVEVAQVHDDNLFLSAIQPAHDRILRVRPGLDLRFESPRWSADSTYGFDAERFADHASLTDARARQHGLMRVRYRIDPRLTIGMDGNYTDTNTPAELNVLTGLNGMRARAQHLDFGPSVIYKISPRMSGHAAFSSTREKFAGAPGMRSMSETFGIEERTTPRDAFTADCEHVKYLFDLGAAATSTNTYVLRGGWTHALSPRTRFTLQAGPRLTNQAVAPELAVSFNHDWQFSSVTVTALQTETTAIGVVAPIEARSLQAIFTYKPSRPLTAFAASSAVRSVYGNLNAIVYRIGLGAHYAITPLSGFDVTYTHDSQHGVFNASQNTVAISRSILSVGFTTRWTAPDILGTERR
jgi:hypothetical protein